MPDTCPHCGARLPEIRDAFCPECREDLDEGPVAEEVEPDDDEPYDEDDDDAPRRRKRRSKGNMIPLALGCLHVSAAGYVLIGAGFFAVQATSRDPAGPIIGGIILVFCLGLVTGIEVVAWGISKRYFWGWIAGLIIFGLYLPSLCLPLGALGMWGLLDNGSREEFGVK